MTRDQVVPDPAWLLDAFERSSDVLVVMAEDTIIRWVSSGVRRLGGYEPEELIGRSMVEFVHPDDLDRATEVMQLAGEEQFDEETPMTPALYRMLHSDGSWPPMEVNATRAATGATDLLLVIRQPGDQVLNERLLELVIAGAPFDEQLDRVLELGQWRYPTEGYAVICTDDGGSRVARALGIADPRLSGLAPVPGPTPWDVAMRRGERLVVTDLNGSDLVGPELIEAAGGEGFVGVLAVPVVDPGHPEGACMVVWSTAAGPSVAGQRYPMANMSRALELALQSRAYRSDLERAANVDGLTGVASRQRFFEIGPNLLDARSTAVLYVDLDGFKAVNDRHGHSAGDYVLATTAARLSAAVGPDALVGRLGGDEFAVLCPPGTTAEGAEGVAAAIVEAARQPIELSRGVASVGASIGVAMREGDESIDAVLERADRGLLAAKAAGKGSWQLVG
jgi:diguanylate cyclase (GGDEF)-like protein/PAS domain S-box-containing protein